MSVILFSTFGLIKFVFHIILILLKIKSYTTATELVPD